MSFRWYSFHHEAYRCKECQFQHELCPSIGNGEPWLTNVVSFLISIFVCFGNKFKTAKFSQMISVLFMTVPYTSLCFMYCRMFLRTGSLNSPSGLDLQQISGFTIGAERLNYMRYMSHFRSIHRGRFFTEMKVCNIGKLGVWNMMYNGPWLFRVHFAINLMIYRKKLYDPKLTSLGEYAPNLCSFVWWSYHYFVIFDVNDTLY